MPTISTVMPAGGGDFTTAQAWENFADGEANADQWAECYSGGSLGALTFGGWVATPTTSVFPRIYAAYGHQFRGVIAANNASIAGATNAVWDFLAISICDVEGLLLQRTAAASNAHCVQAFNQTRLRFFSCGIRHVGGLDSRMFSGGDEVKQVSLFQCVLCALGQTANVSVGRFRDTCTFLNNVIVRCGTSGTYSGIIIADGTQTWRNNIVEGGTFNSAGKTYTHNISTGTLFGGSNGNQQNVALADVFTDHLLGDFTLKAGSPALDAGFNTSGTLPLDIAGNDRLQGDAVDIGVFEFVPTANIFRHTLLGSRRGSRVAA